MSLEQEEELKNFMDNYPEPEPTFEYHKKREWRILRKLKSTWRKKMETPDKAILG